MDISVILPFIGALIVLYLILKVLSLPIKLIVKLLANGLIGGVIIFVINLIGSSFNFALPLEWWSAILVGILGIPGAIILVLIQLFI